MSCPAAAAWSRSCWASARFSIHHRWSSVAGSGVMVGFVLEVPAFPALRRPQRLGPLRAGRADAGEGVPARDEHGVFLAGVQVGAAQLDGADAGAVLDGQVLDDLPGQRHGHPLRPRRPASCGVCRSLGTSTQMIGITSIWVGAVQVPDQPHRRHSYRGEQAPSSSRIRPVAQTGHGSSVRQAVTAVIPAPPPAQAGTGPPSPGYQCR